MKKTIHVRRWRRFGKRVLAAALVFAMLAQNAAPLQAEGAEGYVTLPAATMPAEIQEADTFYVGTTSADLEENAKAPYLLQIGRGGSAEKAASVVLKISDATAGYGKDYKIRLHDEGAFGDGKTEADSPEDNKSLLDLISENEVIEDLQLTEEEQEAAEQENLENLEQGALEFSEELQGNGQQEDSGDLETKETQAKAAAPETEETQEEDGKKAAVKGGAGINNPLAQAKETLTGVASDRENVTSTQQSMVDVLSDTGNYLTQLVPGATLKVDFAAGEKTKYVEIETIDNDISDGARSFYVTLSEPSEGMTNSSVSESIFTIRDDEPQEDAVVSFAAAEFTAEAGSDSVEVVLTRTGAMTQMVSVHMTSEANSAVSGQDFAPVNADVVFPFGITERRLKIAVDAQYLEQDADFTLQITDGSGAKAGESSQARVVIKTEEKAAADSQKAEEGKTDKTEEVSAQASLSDKRYGDNINLYDAAWYVRSEGGDTSWGVNNDGPKGRIYSSVDDSWMDIAVALSGNNGKTKHTQKVKIFGQERTVTYYTYSATRQYVYDGFRFRWRKYSGKSSWSSANVAYYRANETSDAKLFFSTGDDPRFDWEEREYYFGNTDAAAVKFWNYNWKGKKNTLDIDWIKPILRPFKVELAPADKLTYYNGSGSTKVENANAVASTLLDSSGGYAVKYDGDKMVISQNNALLGISRLAGVEIVSTYSGRSGSKRIDSRFLNGFKKGDSKIQVSLNNDFCTTYAWYIGYEGNGGSSMRGKIKLKPVYEHIDSKLTVNRNTEKTASGGMVDCKVQINGKEVSYGQALTYHMGDRLSLSSSISGGDYVATGMELSFKNNKTGRNEVNQYGYNQGRYVMDVSRESYTAVPMFTENDNRIVIRVSENDVKNFKASGIFDASYLNQYGTKSSGYYSIEVVGTAQMKDMAGASVTLAAEAKDGYIPIWQETNSGIYFMGTTFEYTAKTRRTANIVSLYASKASANYGAVKGSVYYENLALNNPTAAGEVILPADGGYLSAAGQFAIADENGAVQTPAFMLPGTITKDGKAVRIDKPYVRALAGAAGATQYKDICLRTSGDTVSVPDAAGTERKAYLTELSAVTISSNTGENTRFSGVYIKNKNFPTDTAYMNDESTSISVSVTEMNGEKVKSVNFLVYDRYTNEIKHTIAAGKSGATWTGMYTFKSDGSEDTLYAEGDRIYVQMTTDKKAQVLNNVDDKGNPVVSDSELNQAAKDSLNQTTYAPVNTGYTLVKSGLYEEPTTQSLDIGSLKGLSGIPLVNNFNTNLDLGPLNLTVENLYDDQRNVCGTRLKAAIGLDFEKTRFGASDNYMVKDDGMDYGVTAMTLLKDFGKVKDGFKAAADNIAGAKNLGKTGLASMGAKKWGVYPSVGFYLDFAVAYKTDDAGTVSDSCFVLQGGGIYLGAAANYSVVWYALIPVVYIPCYFGVAGNLSLSLQAGATTTVEHTEEPVTVEDFTGTSHNLSETLDFDFKFSAAGQVQVYCGVGICGTLGVRGGLQVDAGFTWYPTLHKHNPYFDQVGFTLDVGFKMWVDLLVFTIPIPVYSIPTQNFGLNKQYEDLKDKNEDDLNTIIGNKVKTAKADNPFQLEKQTKQEETGITYLLKERDNDPSSWSGKMDGVSADSVATMATYKEKNTHTLQADGYDRPDSQMIDMGEYGTLLVFLQDDKSRADAERTAVSYSVYKDGTYSDPVIIQKDGTADYQPGVTDAGDNILITWVSGDPSKDKGDVNDSAYQSGYLKSQEVYMVSVPKADLAAHKEIVQKDITKLTDDEYYDSDPVAVYDKTSGDINVYYVKTAEDNGITDIEATDLANPMNTSGKTYSVIAYRVYDASQGKWAVEDYEEKEKPENVTDAEYKAQLLALGGQRMLSSPIQSEDIDMEDPLISDFTAIGYNGVAVFAYTIDKGYSADTDTDRDLFLQLYDFNTRSTYKPIRITDDNVADSMPQLIRRGGDEEGTTYLFWKSGDTLDYIDVTRLVKYGIDDNGSIRPEALEQPGDDDVGDGSEGSDEDIYEGMTPEEEARATYSFHIKEVDAYGANENQYASYSQYRVAVDADNNLYLIWVDNGDPEGKTPSQEIYAAAMVESEVAGSTEGEDSIKAWSAPNKLTNFGKYVDEPAFAITKEGRMLLAYNKYDITEDANGNPRPADMELASSMLEPYGSVEATVIALSDITPVTEQEVEVFVRFENTGLTVAKDGFEAEIFEKAADGTKKLIETYKHEAGLIATGIVNETFLYTANEKTPGSVIEVSVTENSLEGTNVNSSESFVEAAEYEITQNNAYQGPDSKFYSEVVITNTGNKPSAAGDELRVDFAGPYGNAASYGLDTGLLAKKSVALKPGESETVLLELDIPAKAFRYYGKIDVDAKVVNKDSKAYGDAFTDTVYMSQPAELTLNGNKNLEMKVGETKELNFQYGTCAQLKAITPSYVSDDESVVRMEDGKIVAVGEGSVTVTAYAFPYNTAASVHVTVKADGSGTEQPGGTQQPGETEQPVSLAKVKIKGMASDAKKQLTVSWGKVKDADGYEVTYATNKAFTKNKGSKKTAKTSLTLKKLSQSKTWYVKVRAYANKGGRTYTGTYSKVRYIKLSKRPAKVKKVTVKPETGKLMVTAASVKGASGYEIVISADRAGKKAVAAKKTKKGRASFTKLKKKKTYYVTVRSYKKTKDGGYLYSAKTLKKTKTK